MLLISASRAHIEYFVTQSFVDTISSLSDSTSPALRTVLGHLNSLAALSTIISPRFVDALSFIETTGTQSPYLSSAQFDTIRSLVNDLLEQLLPEAIALTDAWEFSDATMETCMRTSCDGWSSYLSIRRRGRMAVYRKVGRGGSILSLREPSRRKPSSNVSNQQICEASKHLGYKYAESRFLFIYKKVEFLQIQIQSTHAQHITFTSYISSRSPTAFFRISTIFLYASSFSLQKSLMFFATGTGVPISTLFMPATAFSLYQKSFMFLFIRKAKIVEDNPMMSFCVRV
jgi:hypothetical protein